MHILVLTTHYGIHLNIKNSDCLLDLSECPITVNVLNAEFNPICHLLALLGSHHILHVSMLRVKILT